MRKVHLEPDAMRYLAEGSQNRVWKFEEAGQQSVLKIPHVFISQGIRHKFNQLLSFFGGQDLQTAQKDLDLVSMYFREEIVHTEIIQSPDKEMFVFRQEMIDCVRITPELMRDSVRLRRKMQSIMERNGDMLNEQGRWLDAMGCDPGRLLRFLSPEGTPYFDNVVLKRGTEDDVKIIDVATYGLGPHHLPLYCVQHENAKRFGLSFGGEKLPQHMHKIMWGHPTVQAEGESIISM